MRVVGGGGECSEVTSHNVHTEQEWSTGHWLIIEVPTNLLITIHLQQTEVM